MCLLVVSLSVSYLLVVSLSLIFCRVKMCLSKLLAQVSKLLIVYLLLVGKIVKMLPELSKLDENVVPVC